MNESKARVRMLRQNAVPDHLEQGGSNGKTSTFLSMMLGIGLPLSLLASAQAHHSVASHFDMSRTIEIHGTVVDFKLRSPHASMIVDGQSYVDGVLQDQEVLRWEIESQAAPGLRAMGVDADTFKPGDAIIVVAAPNRQPGYRFVNSSTFINGEGHQYSRAGTEPYRPANPEALAARSGLERFAGRWRSPGAFAREESPLPLNEAGLAAWRDYDARQSPANTCEPMNVPDIFNAPYLFEVRVEGDVFVIHNQPWEVERSVPLDGSEVSPEPSGLFGTTRGRLEDGAVVLESRDFPPSGWGLASATQYLGSGADIPSSAQKRLSERFSLDEDGQGMLYEYVLEDSTYLSQAFQGRLEFQRVADDTPMYPYDCEEESASMFSREPGDESLRVGD